jgi:twitching motility protein PilT
MAPLPQPVPAPTRVPPVAEAPRPVPPAMPLPPPQPASVVPIARTPIRHEAPAPAPAGPTASGLDRLLRVAAARGASTLYLASLMPPSVRVDGEVVTIEGEAPLGPNDVESLLLALMPQRNHEALRAGAATEWMCDVAGVGRVRCMTFRDHHGPGGVFRIMPGRVVTADQLGLSRHLQALAIEPEGLLLVTGPRLSGKRTLISAFVDLINRTRRDHVITVESEITVVHEPMHALISQREARGGPAEMLAVAQAALREDPDILVLESLRAPGLVNVALEAAAAGQLVIAGFPAHSTTSAIDRIINACSPDDRRAVQLSLAENRRGAVAQLLVRRMAGGRLAAREVLLNTPAVASAIAEGRTSQLPIAIEGGRRYGMVSMNDALAGLVQAGGVDAREAYRASHDRAGLLATFARLGLDTTFIERRA